MPGVSNAFATALWAPDALFELWRAGVDGVNVHVREATVNAPFGLTHAGLDARPLLYGLIMFARTLGPGARLITPRVHAPKPLHLKVWAVHLSGGAVRVLVIDKGQRPATVRLTGHGRGVATLQRLLAPSAGSRSGVTLGGRWLTRAGGWTGPDTGARVAPSRGGYELTVPGMSAALVTIPS